MQTIKKIIGGILPAGIFFLLFLVIFQDKIHLPAWLQVAGRMHPMLVHFPITLLLVYFVIFWIPATDSAASWIPVIGFIAALSAVVTAIMGVLLSIQENFDGSTFTRHKWGGVLIAFLACGLYYLHYYFINKKRIARAATILFSLLILFTGHWGGNLTHGENYLLQPYAKAKKAVPLSEAYAFDDVVLPIFENKCGSCHSNGNSKGGLSVSDSAGITAGGKTGPFFIAGDAAKSLFIERIVLPLSDKKHMAPASKPQVTDDELQLLTAWVKSGAPMKKKVIELPPTDTFRLMASRSLINAENTPQAEYDFPAADEKTVKSLNNNYRVLTPEGEQSAALAVQFYGSKAYTSKSLEELLAVKQQIISLNLSKMPVKNDEMKIVQQMPNLEKINLNYTDINDDGLAHLFQLKKLKEIALSGTPVSVKSIQQLLKNPSINSVYIWNTSIDTNAVRTLQNQYKNVHIETGYTDDGQEKLPLNPPVAKLKPGVYDPGMQAPLGHPMHGVEIRYTLDGSEPDSLNSAIYKEPLRIDSFTVIKAKAYKPKWWGSKTLTAAYFTKGIKPDSVAIVSEEGNKGKGNLLFDTEVGDINVGTSKWMGFQKPFTCYLFFNRETDVHRLRLNMFWESDYNILPPAKIEIWAGQDQQHLKLIKSVQESELKRKGMGELVQPYIDFKGVSMRCMKIILTPWKIKKYDMKCYLSEMVLL